MTIIRRTVVGASTLGLIASLLTGAFANGAELPKCSARGQSYSQTALAAEEERAVSKPIVSAGSVRAAPLVFDATRTRDAAAEGY
jgi:hypothetical protein